MNLMTMMGAVSTCIALVLPAAQAAEQDAPAGCRAEVQKYCKDVRPGGGRMMQCLKAHEGDLSPDCRRRIGEGVKKMEEMSQACKSDVDKLCQGVEPGQGRVMRCLADNKAQLSPACRERIEHMGKRRPCAEDAARLCAGTQAGEGRVADCLKRHQGELSADCKAHMKQHRRDAKDERAQ